jgi:hypothetical protein
VEKMSPELLALVQSALSGLFAGGGVWMAQRVENRMMWREHDRSDKRLTKLEDSRVKV